MYLYRALNSNDLSTINLEEGLYSKDVTEQLKFETFSFLLWTNEKLKDEFGKLSKEDKMDVYRTYEHDFSFDVQDLKHLTNIKLSKVNMKDKNKITKEDFKNIIEVLSTINTHLVHGSRVDTAWISFTSDIHQIEKYYLTQKNHKVAVIDSNVNLILDGDIIAIDLSSREAIKKLSEYGFLISKFFQKCSFNFRGYNNSAKDREVIYYSHIPQEKITTVLEPIQIDLIYNDIFNEKFYQLSNNSKKIVYEMFKSYLKNNLLGDLSDIEKRVLFEHYFNNQSLSTLSSHELELQKLIIAKKQILSKIPINSLTSQLMKNTCPDIILPEEKRYYKS